MIHTRITALAVAAVLASAAPGFANEVYTLRLADQFPLTHKASKAGIQDFIALVEERSEGRIKFTHFPAQQLAKGNGMLDAVRSGVADLALQVAGVVSDRLPLTTVVELPALSTGDVDCYEKFQVLSDTYLQEVEYDKLGVRAIQVQCTPSQVLITRDVQVESLDDLAGLKLRAGGSVVELTLTGVGAVPVKLSGPDIYLGLERGTLDGAVFAPTSAVAYKLQDIVSGAAQNLSFGSQAAVLFMNEGKFQELPEDLQAIIVEAGREIGVAAADFWVQDAQASLDEMAAGGVTVYDLPEDVLNAVGAAQEAVTADWIAQMEARGYPGQATVDAMKAIAN